MVMGMRSVQDSHIGDTFHAPNSSITPLPGFKPAKPMVSNIFAHVFFKLYNNYVYTLKRGNYLAIFSQTNSKYYFAHMFSKLKKNIICLQIFQLYIRYIKCCLQVFAGVYPMESNDYPSMRLAVEKLTLNDSSVSVHRDSSVALGQGWRLGFLGLLHMDVFRQRLEEVNGIYLGIYVPKC